MKTLILYNSKTGFTLKCATYLKDEIEGSVMFPFESKQYDITEYDKILIGAPIYFGGINKKIISFVSKNKTQLLKKELGMFYSGMKYEDFSKTVQNSLPPEIFYHASIIHSGGAYYFEKLNFINRFFIKRIAKVYKTTEDFHIENLKDLL